MTKIKICGLTRMRDIDAVNIAHPDYAGFVFARGRRRTIDELEAAIFRDRLLSDIKTVGVFLDNAIKEIEELCKDGIIDVVQLHGSEDKDFISELRCRTDLPVIKAVSVRSAQDILDAQALPCDYLLLDTYKKGQSGGTGESFDWNMIPHISKPFFLAGGINEDNISSALRLGAYAIDVSSGAEINGKKDLKKIISLVRKVRGD